MNITEQEIGSVRVLTIAGRIDSVTSKSLEDIVIPKMQVSPALVIDLDAVQYVSSAGLRVLLKAAKIAKATGHRLVLSALAPQVQEVFDISGFSSIFEIQFDQEKSLKVLA
ncbi:STAS domain-containing protein [Agrobacterium vitis]|uniref:Anti-sigma factor antagonist n=1 Tax=Agrobacterium vitis TaxID=373 RepID=A0AAE4WBQ4_AGRVI|nr:STAS domain-containing protein [Agrobacterium vitis]MCF1499339.1 STAS domain-containing protein [Allorhizobium sp. Av2]MCM2439410.1 STAS domain-containing protein [Agrobacterium vitis]MUZ57686.1 anti-sigma factor antagonist [Agrobacterium vitis]